MDSAIKINSLRLSYRKQAVLKGLDWEIPRGSVCALIGLNGSGKTTLLRILAGLLEAEAGSAYILDRKVKHGESIREASFMFEPSPLDKSLTARQNIRLRCTALGEPVARADYLIRKAGLEITSKPVKNYSVGMRKRLELAYALAGDPELLVLDEPFDGVDIRRLIRIEHAVEMIELVADGAGKKAARDEGIFIAVPVLKDDLHPIGTDDGTRLAAHRKAPLGAALLPLLGDDDGIDELKKALLHIHLYGADGNAHLRSGKPRALGVFEGILHVVEQFEKLGVETGDRFAFFSEDGISDLNDFTDHNNTPLYLHKISRAKARRGGAPFATVRLYRTVRLKRSPLLFAKNLSAKSFLRVLRFGFYDLRVRLRLTACFLSWRDCKGKAVFQLKLDGFSST